ncbi:MAG: ABC transporter ATP-binding protein [Tepidiformaceae bacterium]
MAILVMSQVTKVYGKGSGAVLTLDAIDLELQASEVVAVMGPSGAGKTTLLTIAGALQRPTSGTVEVAGEAIHGLPERELARVRREQVGFVFQSFNLLMALTALENVQYAMELGGQRGGNTRERAKALLGMLGLGHRLDQLPKLLSGGEQQRVCIARAIANNAPLLLADEPTANLDTQRATDLMGLLRALARDQGQGVLLVTHDLRAHHLADRLLWLEDGHLGPITPAEIAARAAHGAPAARP